ncbi:MAG: phosphoribosylglycinamide formyltransferase [Proteobacteria bacterium]|nr:MAG: phosphoribosylglycinamide formyltransferase [Pseudomonadota bacterium]
MRFGVLVSGGGSNLQAILDARASGELDATCAVVISNKRKAGALARAERAGVPAAVIPHRRFDSREAFEDALIDELGRHQVDWVVLAGFMRVLTPHFLAAFPARVVNIHPALLPAFPGIDAQRQAFEYGVKVAGCTVHLVDAGTDTGPILAQRTVPVLEDDDVERLRRRILAAEHALYPQVLQRLAAGGLTIEGRRARLG